MFDPASPLDHFRQFSEIWTPTVTFTESRFNYWVMHDLDLAGWNIFTVKEEYTKLSNEGGDVGLEVSEKKIGSNEVVSKNNIWAVRLMKRQ